MPIPLVFGKGKIKLIRGDDPQDKPRRKAPFADLTFSFDDSFGSTFPAPSFNVLYVQTPRIELLETPAFQALVQTWNEAVELVKPLFRFGFPETSLRTKCPYYNEHYYSTQSGALLPNDRLRKVLTGIASGAIGPQRSIQYHHANHQLQSGTLLNNSSSALQESSSTAALGQHPHQHLPHIPKSHMLVPRLPSGTLVLGLNLLAYWLLLNQSKRTGVGGLGS